MIKFLKIFCAAGFLVVFVSNVLSISGWTENRAVYDDICYLRQAHLFERFGLGGIVTDIARDDDDYLRNKLKEIDFETWGDAKTAPCHTFMPGSGMRVLQYPPGTGFVLSLFPAGFQVIPLYILATIVALGFSLLAITRAATIAQLALVAAFGDSAIYLMINPTKASYSMAPTMIVCALAGFLTVRFFLAKSPRERLLLASLVGFLIGLSVNFRLANLFLSAGYCVYLLAAFSLARSRETFLQGLLFGTAFLVGLVPTLIANAVNAGSPFSTTYSSIDAVSPELKLDTLILYAGDMQSLLLAIAVGWLVLILRFSRGWHTRQVALLVAANLAINVLFFFTHPVVTPYYTVPISMLSLWTLLFTTLSPGEKTAENPTFAQSARA
ncbi:MAG: hypothetical protein KIT82_16930 [Bradyrhizobium sp.]|nr:hypothetical protein [Bradyrhizobium sp.]